VQPAVAAVETGRGKVVPGKAEQVHDPRMTAAGDGDDPFALDVDVEDVLAPHL
jgi:hypothetical protein